MIGELTAELGELVATATELPTSIDPIRPPQIPGCFVGPPSLTPDAETSGRLLLVQWETGTLVTARTGAWSEAARLGEQICAAITAHPTLGLIAARSSLYPQADAGDAPGYRVDVAVLLHVSELVPISPAVPPVDVSARLSAIATLAAEIVAAPVVVLDVSAELRAVGSLSAVLTVDPVVAWSPEGLPNLTGWFDAANVATIYTDPESGNVTLLGNQAPGFPGDYTIGYPDGLVLTGAEQVNGNNVLTVVSPPMLCDYKAAKVAPFTLMLVHRHDGPSGRWWVAPANHPQQVYDALGGAGHALQYTDGAGAVIGSVEAPPLPTPGAVEQVVVVIDGASSSVRVNGGPAVVGSIPGNVARWCQVEALGLFCEQVHFQGRPTDDDLVGWDGYCSEKWGTP